MSSAVALTAAEEAVRPFADGQADPTYEIRYLFEVTYRNGGRYLQNAADVSAFDAARTPWWDVQTEKIQPLAEVETLALFGEGRHVLVDCESGEILVDGRPVWCCDTLSYLPDGVRVQPVYGRRVRRRWQVGYNLETGRPETRQATGLYVLYMVGWDCIVEGVPHQARLSIA